MITIQLTPADLAPEEIAAETWLDARHYDRVIRTDTKILKPNGQPLLIYVKDALSRSACQRAFDVLKDAPLVTDTRGAASGDTDQRVRVESGVVGFMDRKRNVPYCRQTTLTRDHPNLYPPVRALAREASRHFQALAPDRWRAQLDYVARVQPEYVMARTVFTSVTVNRSWRTAAHRDSGDLRQGFGVLAVLEGGRFQGCELIFPHFRTAVDLRTGGLCLADVHQLHGNAPLWGERFTRLSLVFYVRTNMKKCLPFEQERQHAARRIGPLDGDE